MTAPLPTPDDLIALLSEGVTWHTPTPEGPRAMITSPTPRAGGGAVSPTKLADVLHGAYRVIGEDVPEEQRWLAVAFAAIGALESECATALAAREAETREACAKMIPDTWLDPMLTGERAALRGSGPWGCPDIERLLSRVAAAIRASAP